MTDILLLNIQKKDELYIKYLKAKPNSVEKFEFKSQLKKYERDIDEWTLEAKKEYFSNQFSAHTDDVKKTWDTIKTAINRRCPQSSYPDRFEIDGKCITDKLGAKYWAPRRN